MALLTRVIPLRPTAGFIIQITLKGASMRNHTAKAPTEEH
jgi:hypothetical protein